ncbi:MAG: 2-C-methyl-D-erythritol 4-phosphate cytidylyltransferase [Eubacteriales bacterium]|nr:2-C-methyl-D-erythritol 4-phosphate cytidylyltransferase [Eubacteriales bacterium]
MYKKRIMSVLIPAAGISRRMEGLGSKPYITLFGRSVLYYVLRAFAASPYTGEIIAAVRAGEEDLACRAAADACPEIPFKTVIGGTTRQESVYSAITVSDDSFPLIAVHDAARPCITAELINKVAEAALTAGAATAATPMTDTVGVIETSKEGAVISGYEDREKLVRIATPQIFNRGILIAAHESARANALSFTDDTSLVGSVGTKTMAVISNENNIKITVPADLATASAALSEMMNINEKDAS